MNKLSFKKNDVIFKKGESADSFFKIAKGKVSIRDGDKVLAVLKDGAFFGETSIIENAPRNATAIADSDAEIFSISAAAFKNFVAFNTPDVINMMKDLSASLKKATKKLLSAAKTIDSLLTEEKENVEKTAVVEKLKVLEGMHENFDAFEQEEMIKAQFEPVENVPEDAMQLLKNLSKNLRATTDSYCEACETIKKLLNETERSGGIWSQLGEFANEYDRYMSLNIGGYSPFDPTNFLF